MKNSVLLLLVLVLAAAVAFGGSDKKKEKLAEDRAASISAGTAVAEPASINGGWAAKDLENATHDLRGVHYLGGGVIWVDGFNTTNNEDVVFRSVDNGATWVKKSVPATGTAGFVFAAKDSSIAIAATFQGLIARTTNGGNTWDSVYAYSYLGDGFFDGISFLGSTKDTVIAFGDADSAGLHVVRSTNAGLTWTKLTMPDTLKEAGKWFGYATYRNCTDAVGGKFWAALYAGAGINGRMLKTTDYGATWSTWQLNLPGGAASDYRLKSITFMNDTLGFGVANSVAGTADWLVKTTNGGTTWGDTISLRPGYPHAAQAPRIVRGVRGTTMVVATGATGSSFISNNLGSSWTLFPTGTVNHLYGNDFASASLGWAVGLHAGLVYTPPVPVGVTFAVNMKIKLLEQTFKPSLGDIVTVPGAFNGWNTATDTLKDLDGDSIYTKTVNITEGTAFGYKYFKTVRGGLDWETNPDRQFTAPFGGGGNPVTPYFDNDSIYNAPVTANVKWETNMKVFNTLGWFDYAKDTMQVRGSFEGWGGTKLAQDLIDVHRFNLTRQYVGSVGDALQFKYYMRLDSVTAVGRWGADYSTHMDDYNYEHPAERGDGNQTYTVTSGVSQNPGTTSFSQVGLLGVLNATDSVNVTFSVNMGPAKRYASPFVPASDTLKLVVFNRLWLASQWKSVGTAAYPEAGMMMTQAPGGGDSIYQVTLKVKGKTHYNIIYYYRVKKSDGTGYDEGGGLGGQNPYRSRFIRNGQSGAWPASYAMPQDTWKKDAPLFCETALFPTEVTATPTTPLIYALEQNYPNPFNPTTTIRYTLPVAGHATLKVFNMIGQEVATLFDGNQIVGNHVVSFDAARLSTGVYFYRLEAGKFIEVKKMVLVK